MPSKTLLLNARIFTGLGDSPEPAATCILVDNGLIEHIGGSEDAEVQHARQVGVHEHDVGGRMIVPGFIDGHMHILLFGSSLTAIDIEHCKNLEDIRSTIKTGAAAQPHALRLFVQGWMHFQTGGRALASDIDDLDPRPIFISSRDLHSAWCNTAALTDMELEGVPNPHGGEILRNENGKATGLLSEAAAVSIVWPHLSKVVGREEKLSQIREAILAYNTAGYTGMVEMATDEEIWSLLTELRNKEGQLNIRIAAHWLIKPSKIPAENIAQVNRAIELHSDYNLDTNPDLRIAGIKVIGDGVVDACTASLLEPYCTPSTNADPIWSYEQLLPVVQHADAAGLQCALHAIGDRTVKVAVDVLSTLAPSASENRLRDRRHRIEHLELTSQDDARRLGELGITASIQPVHADPILNRAWRTLLGPERHKRGFAYKEFADGGAHVAIGTDAPTALHLPLRNLYIATTRRSAREETSAETMNEEFKLKLGQALSAASFGAAYSCFADNSVGTLEKGKLADFAVVDMIWDADQLLKGRVDETWLGGQCVFRRL
ncbi:hypothetical protein LTS08_001560 [Lithohypha guttulata]|uniref:uncharacterized protein n=1 Tax=Lithohypha guttulata TaxID=1690604 RepID=UPI002DDE83BE|nr:hypothetical protein LTR51_003772 [Lithohypha guttulata]KAK5105284.1 hypothetical protein LTS08_001560 [Lithohypha guttulata]